MHDDTACLNHQWIHKTVLHSRFKVFPDSFDIEDRIDNDRADKKKLAAAEEKTKNFIYDTKAADVAHLFENKTCCDHH